MIIDFRINTENKPWNEVPIIMIDTKNIEDHPALIAIGMANANKAEVRWNYNGLEQGHYVGTEYKFQKIMSNKGNENG